MINGAPLNVLDFGAVGDGVADDTTALQTAITYAFDNKIGTVYLPAGTYKVTKPLYLWGSDNYIRSGVQLVGEGIDSTVIKKSGNGTPADGSWYATIDAVVILTPKPAPVSATPVTGTYNTAIIDMSIVGDAASINDYGIYTKDDFGQVKMERLCVINTDTCFRTDGNMFLSSFRNISLHPATDGFWMGASGTSIDLTNVYVLGGAGVGFNLQALYSTANAIAVEGFTGTPVQLRFSNWTVNGLGVECAAATGAAVVVANGSTIVLNNPLILAPNAFICSDGCKMIVSGAQIGDEFAPATRTGYLWFVGGSGALSLLNLINYDTHTTASTGYAMVTNLSGSAPFTTKQLLVQTIGAANTETAIELTNATPAQLFKIRADGLTYTGTAPGSPYNFTSASAANLGVVADGSLYRSTSSLKYKKNVKNSVHGLADVLKLRSVTYEGKSENDAGRTFGGLIAEEVHAAGLTEFVMYAEDGTPDALAYGNMVSLLVKAVQELSAEIQALKNVA